MKIILVSSFFGIATSAYTSNLFGLSLTNTGYVTSFDSSYSFDENTGGLNWDVTSEKYEITVHPNADDYIAVLSSAGLGLTDAQKVVRYQLCVKHDGKDNPADMSDSCAQDGNIGTNSGDSWTPAVDVDVDSTITLSRTSLTVHCDYDDTTLPTYTNNYNVSMDFPAETLEYGSLVGGTITHTSAAVSVTGVPRIGDTEKEQHYKLTRPAPADDPVDACAWTLVRSDDVDIHVRFLDSANAIIQHSTLTAGINGAIETMSFAGFNSTAARDMSEVADLGVGTNVGVEAYDDVETDETGATASGSTDAIAAGTFKVACSSSLTKLGVTSMIRNQLAAFKMAVSGCQIAGGAGAPVEVHWASMVSNYDDGDFTLNACGSSLHETIKIPSAAEETAITTCTSLYSNFAYGAITAATGDILQDKLGIFLSTNASAGTEALGVADVNTCVMRKTADDLGTCADPGLTDSGVADAEHVSWAVARYDHDGTNEQAGFEVYFYMVIADDDTSRLDLQMELQLDAEFRQD